MPSVLGAAGVAAHIAHNPSSFNSTFSVPHPLHVPIIEITSFFKSYILGSHFQHTPKKMLA